MIIHNPFVIALLLYGSSDIWSLGCILYELCTLKHPIITEYGEQILEETKKSKHSTRSKKADPSRIRIALENEGSRMVTDFTYFLPFCITIPTFLICISNLLKQEEEQGKKCSRSDLENINKNLVESALKRVNREEKGEFTNVVFLQLGGSVIKYSENNTRKQWLRETPETLLNILKNADLSLAFETYTIYRSGSEGFLKGPLSEDTEASDSVDGDHESVILDPERLEPRLDEEDTYVLIYLENFSCVYESKPHKEIFTGLELAHNNADDIAVLSGLIDGPAVLPGLMVLCHDALLSFLE
ncbi:Serine/threonine-protein kinase Nek3 [Galemys pyrenaicus]|uniref:Serine/threonine-protein kinase Nek3 n=1 Tax=Galemys pyrenaicus TaxID=202257 RepID=A0A8J6APE3_GALPY|nr:Serine/threonine-protein kinase Nek3 [Galemys pyrenaicus]